MFRIPIYLTLLATCAVALATVRVDPTLLYRVTREDGVVENLSALALLGLGLSLGWRLWRQRPPALQGWPLRGAWALVVLAFLGVGEEISWGQRVFGWETGEAMNRYNLQHETNLHNLMPGELFNGLIVFAVGIGFVLIPTLWRGRPSAPVWLPSDEVSLLLLDAILINHYRFRTAPEKVGIVVMLALLLYYSWSGWRDRSGPLMAGAGLGWLVAVSLYWSRGVLRAANHQYEIRELLIVLLLTVWAHQAVDAYKAPLTPPTKEGQASGRLKSSFARASVPR